MRSALFRIVLTTVLATTFVGCTSGGGGDDDPGETAAVPANAAIIVFPGGAGWGDVVFTHATHADEYYDGVCIHCHDHETVGAETHWLCSECHSAGTDAEGLCDEYANHGCIMTQCQNCHLLEGGNPAPDGDSCGDCHGSPEFAETIVFVGGGGYGPVGFTHMKHSTEYYGGNCMECHDHDEGIWSCGDCHTTGSDPEELCDEKEDHGCIMTQCQDCHLASGPPAPDGQACGDCHGFPQYATTIEFPGGGNCESVTFTHQQHAMQYSDGRCRDCHKMEADFWMCRLCHTYGGVGGPNDGNCEMADYSDDFDPVHGAFHGCITYQCMQCHQQYSNDPDVPDGSHCVDCHDSCGCPPPDGQEACECSDCHNTYLVNHNDDACTSPDCHGYENHSANWEPCTNANCHAAHEAMDDWHDDWQFGTGLCANTVCHDTFDTTHGGWACNYRCHSDLPRTPAGGLVFHDYDDSLACLAVGCHGPIANYVYPTHQEVDALNNCLDAACHPNQPHDPNDGNLIDWATCGTGRDGSATVRCHGPTLDATVADHEAKACDNTACHWDYPPTTPHDEQGCSGLNNGCHPFVDDYPFNISEDDGSHVTFTWEPCANNYCHEELSP